MKSASPSAIMKDRCQRMMGWYGRMVDTRARRFMYEYDPRRNAGRLAQSPIRNIATLWDASIGSVFVENDALMPVVEDSLCEYEQWIEKWEDNNRTPAQQSRRDETLLRLREEDLREPSNIAHSAFMIVSLVHYSKAMEHFRSRSPSTDDASAHRAESRRVKLVEGLCNGIVARQRETDGSFVIHWNPSYADSGADLYAGEAMLALLEAYDWLRSRKSDDALLASYLNCVLRALSFYDSRYYRKGLVAHDVTVFFANWQSQACAKLWDVLASLPAGVPVSAGDAADVSRRVSAFLVDVHDRIVAQGFYERVERKPRAAATVEVACALEGLCDAYWVLWSAAAAAAARQDDDTDESRRKEDLASEGRMQAYAKAIGQATRFLLDVQEKKGNGTGGFPHGKDFALQRIDVTGHALNAFIKLHRLLQHDKRLEAAVVG